MMKIEAAVESGERFEYGHRTNRAASFVMDESRKIYGREVNWKRAMHVNHEQAKAAQEVQVVEKSKNNDRGLSL